MGCGGWGLPLTGHRPLCALTDEGLWDILIKDIPKEVTSYTFSMDMLRPGVSYDFRVIAVNDYGFGAPSSPSQSVPGTGLRGEGQGAPRKRRGAGEEGEALGWGPQCIVLSVPYSGEPRVSFRKKLGTMALWGSFSKTPDALGGVPSGIVDKSVGPR